MGEKRQMRNVGAASGAIRIRWRGWGIRRQFMGWLVVMLEAQARRAARATAATATAVERPASIPVAELPASPPWMTA